MLFTGILVAFDVHLHVLPINVSADLFTRFSLFSLSPSPTAKSASRRSANRKESKWEKGKEREREIVAVTYLQKGCNARNTL